MPNHYHLLLMQKTDDGITEFMRKIGTGYTNFFNKKYERVGPLFQGQYKAILIENDAYFNYIPNYIHLNPLDLIAPNWRRGEIESSKMAKNFLADYRWSSYLDYVGIKNFPSVTQREILSDNFSDPKEYKKEIFDWLKDIELDPIKELLID